MDNRHTQLVFGHAVNQCGNFGVHLANQFISRVHVAAQRREGLQAVFNVVISLELNDKRRNFVFVQGGQKFFVHALVDDNQVRRTGDKAFRVDLIDLSDARQIFRPIGHLIFRIGTTDDIATDGFKRLQKSRARDDNSFGLTVQSDRAPCIILNRREGLSLIDGGLSGFIGGSATCQQHAGGDNRSEKFFCVQNIFPPKG